MAIKFHKPGFDRAVQLIKADEVEEFEADWREEQPTMDEIVRFVNAHTMAEYGLWFLGTDDTFSPEDIEHYKYPWGDLSDVQYCALKDSLEKAQKNGHHEIAKAAEQLLAMIDER